MSDKVPAPAKNTVIDPSRSNVGLSPRPEVKHPAHKPWWCPECAEWVSGADVTYWETHDERYGGCGHKCV